MPTPALSQIRNLANGFIASLGDVKTISQVKLGNLLKTHALGDDVNLALSPSPAKILAELLDAIQKDDPKLDLDDIIKEVREVLKPLLSIGTFEKVLSQYNLTDLETQFQAFITANPGFIQSITDAPAGIIDLTTFLASVIPVTNPGLSELIQTILSSPFITTAVAITTLITNFKKIVAMKKFNFTIFWDPTTGYPSLVKVPIKHDREPVVVVPGLGCTNLDYTYNVKKSNNCQVGACKSRINQFLLGLGGTLWLNVIGLLLQKSCAIAITKPIYHERSHELTNVDGLKVKPHGDYPGDLLACKGLAYILGSDIVFPTTNYSENFANYFVAAGYKGGVDLFTLGFDFRLVPFGKYLTKYFKQLKKLVEKAHKIANKSDHHHDHDHAHRHHKKVHVLGHSLGGSILTMFLNNMSAKWKKRYIASFIADAPAFDGGPKSLRTVLSGDNFGLPSKLAGTDLEWRDSERNMAGIIATIPIFAEMYGPSIAGVGNGDAVIINNPALGTSKTYNVNNYRDGIIGVLNDVAKDTKQTGLLTTAKILKDMIEFRMKYGYSDPGVKVKLLVSLDTSTESGQYTYSYPLTLDAEPSSNSTTLGDATVCNWGLEIPIRNKWKSVQKKVFPSSLFGSPSDPHYLMFVDSVDVCNYILNLTSK
jgi:hypothetical protein